MDHVERKYSIPLHQIVSEFKLETVYGPENYLDRKVSSLSVNRPALPLTGYYEFFDADNIQVIGRVESHYLRSLSDTARLESLAALCSRQVPAIIVTADREITLEYLKAAKLYEVPLFRTKDRTSAFMAALTASLNVALGQRVTMHGVLVEVYGEGILLLGDSGVGKSETAIELVKRGHRLVADDAVDIKRVSAKALVGSAPEMIRYFVELRGIGIVDVRRLFGMGAVKPTEKIDLIINLRKWEDGKHYERLGLDENFTDILGIKVPSLEIPVRPGRNLAVVIEVAAMNNRHKKMGYNAAKELVDKQFASMMAAQENQ